MRVVGVVPAAGFATRLQPLRCSKEVYPVGARPVMDYLVERMAAATPDEIRVVTRPEKGDVAMNAAKLGLTIVEGHPEDLGGSIALGLDGLDDDDTVLLGFPDSIWEPADGYERLLAGLGSGYDVVLGLFPSEAPETCDVVYADEDGRVRAIEHRPPRPTTNVIWGAAACRRDALHGVAEAGDPGVHFGGLCAKGAVRGRWLSDVYVDVGTPAALQQAILASARVRGQASG